MLHKQPGMVPALDALLDDLGNPSPKAVAKALGISERTVRHYKATGKAPRCVLLALFWVSSFGQQWAHADAHNDAVMYYSLASSLARKNKELEAMVNRLISEGQFGSANDPVIPGGVSLRDRALLLRNGTPPGFPPMRVTIPNAHMRRLRR